MLYNDSFRPNFGRHDRYIHALPKAEKLGCVAAVSSFVQTRSSLFYIYESRDICIAIATV